jgi:hypothetical protein
MKILHAGRVSENLLHLRDIAECFGIGTDLVDVKVGQSLPVALELGMRDGNAGLALDLESLKNDAREHELQEVGRLIGRYDAAVLLLATNDDEATNRFLRVVTGGVVQHVNRVARAESVGFPASGASFSRELCLQSYARQEEEALTLALTQDARSAAIMELDGLPSFSFFPSGQSQILIWSTPSIFDVHRPLVAEKEFELATDKYIPAIIFLRSAFADQCWHNPEPAAGIVIDDPLLQKKYGFIDFGKLLVSARKHGYHITLAFIPWNYWRSRSREIRLFLDHSDCFSVCAHGCDHTENEYGSNDYDLLLTKNFVAADRMLRHQRRTGLRFEPVMVCPQEKYSLQAMRAFSDSRQFLGVVCTACMPRDLTSPALTGSDLLLPAQDSFFGFAVFKRHYSGTMRVFALALFLGRPAILVEHHQFFKDGPAGAEEFAKRLAALRSDLVWKPLAETMIRTHVRRRLPDDSIAVRFFTDSFKLEPRAGESGTYRLCRRVPETSIIERILVRGKSIPFDRHKEFVKFEVRAQDSETVFIKVEVLPITSARSYPAGLKYQSSVALRRGLSEFRDNWLDRNSLASAAGNFLKKSLVGRRGSSAINCTR